MNSRFLRKSDVATVRHCYVITHTGMDAEEKSFYKVSKAEVWRAIDVENIIRWDIDNDGDLILG